MATREEEEHSYDIWGTDVKTGKEYHLYTGAYDIPSARRLLWKAQREGEKYFKDIRVIHTRSISIISSYTDTTYELMAPITEEEAAQFEEAELWFDGGS